MATHDDEAARLPSLVVAYGRTNGDAFTHGLTGQRTVCGIHAAELAPGPITCPDCLYLIPSASS